MYCTVILTIALLSMGAAAQSTISSGNVSFSNQTLDNSRPTTTVGKTVGDNEKGGDDDTVFYNDFMASIQKNVPDGAISIIDDNWDGTKFASSNNKTAGDIVVATITGNIVNKTKEAASEDSDKIQDIVVDSSVVGNIVNKTKGVVSDGRDKIEDVADNGVVGESSGKVSFSDLEMCSDSSYDMSKYGPDDLLEPCILYDIRDFSHQDLDSASEAIEDTHDSISSKSNNITTEITIVQVTPSNCHNHRDGAVTAVKLLNANNDGKGTSIGYYDDQYVKFRLISIVGGNAKNIGNDAYTESHIDLLDSTLEEIDNSHFILGSCSFASVADKPIALKREKVVISQVGPPGFYMNVDTNPYVFGIHVNSDTYPLPALRALQFHLMTTATARSLQPVRVIYRDKSEFFYSTCRSVIDEAMMSGFDVTVIEYDPDGDADGSGVPNNQNVPYIESLTDLLCPLTSKNSTDSVDVYDKLPPAIFACVNSEADIILARIRSNGCRPSLSWFTTATWQWASDNHDVVPYFQGGGQWHKNFKYSDNFFQTGQDVLSYGLDEFGYAGSYDHVVSYAIPNLIADLMQSFFRIDDVPDVVDALTNRYEDLRKALLYSNAQTIFGPVSFNKFQRNSGRGAAGVQWIPTSFIDTSFSSTGKMIKKEVEGFVMGCTSPFNQADVPIIIPSPSGSTCLPGSYVNQTMIEIDPSILGKKCSGCPIDSYTYQENEDFQCIACPIGSNTVEESGATYCVQENPNLIPTGIKSMGYLFTVISWSLAIGYIVWMIVHKNDSVVKIGQPEFLLCICVGAAISTSAIIPLTLAEADVGDDNTEASRYCQAVPFLYSLGWVLMYSSLTAKSYRLLKVSAASGRLARVKVPAREMYRIIIGFLILDAIILIAWQVVDPLMYVRSNVTKSMDEDTDVVIVETVGQCTSDSLWKFFIPIIAIHLFLIVITNALLWRVRNMSDRYQEQKFVALASIYICELLLLGVPILAAVKDSAVAQYIVIAGVIFLTDTGVLSLIFIPKIKFQNEGLPDGMSVAQSMRPSTSRASRVDYSVNLSENPGPRNSISRRDTSRRSSSRRASISSLEFIDENEDSAAMKKSTMVTKESTAVTCDNGERDEIDGKSGTNDNLKNDVEKKIP